MKEIVDFLIENKQEIFQVLIIVMAMVGVVKLMMWTDKRNEL